MTEEKKLEDILDSKGYPLWTKLPIEFWVDRDVLEFIKKACEEYDT